MSCARSALAAVLAMLVGVAPGLALGAPKATPSAVTRKAPLRAKSQPLGDRLASEDEKAARQKNPSEAEAKKADAKKADAKKADAKKDPAAVAKQAPERKAPEPKADAKKNPATVAKQAPEPKAPEPKKADAKKNPATVAKQAPETKKISEAKAPETKRASETKSPDGKKVPEAKADAKKALEPKADAKKAPEAKNVPEAKAVEAKKVPEPKAPETKKAPEPKAPEPKADAKRAPEPKKISETKAPETKKAPAKKAIAAKAKPKRPVRALPSDATWKAYRRAPWRRGHVTLFGHGKRWSGFLVNQDNEIPKGAHQSISRVLASWRTGRQILIDDRLIRFIADVSDEFGGRPIRIVSGYRERSYAHDSKHKTGEAFDFSVPGVPNELLRDFLKSLGKVGVGYYPNSTHVHLDVRDKRSYWVDHSLPGGKPRYATDRRVARYSSRERAIGDAMDALDTRATLRALATPPATLAPSAAPAPTKESERDLPPVEAQAKPLQEAQAKPLQEEKVSMDVSPSDPPVTE